MVACGFTFFASRQGMFKLSRRKHPQRGEEVRRAQTSGVAHNYMELGGGWRQMSPTRPLILHRRLIAFFLLSP